MIASSSSPGKGRGRDKKKGGGVLTKGSATRYITERRTRENTMRFDEKNPHNETMHWNNTRNIDTSLSRGAGLWRGLRVLGSESHVFVDQECLCAPFRGFCVLSLMSLDARFTEFCYRIFYVFSSRGPCSSLIIPKENAFRIPNNPSICANVAQGQGTKGALFRGLCIVWYKKETKPLLIPKEKERTSSLFKDERGISVLTSLSME
ncbi:hypothetical protein CEXT_808361 [Caerostris extrusa]|uniref:Ribosomal protein L2 n=1 Tax=Caerostris extrusa TaxID=172846 RepID=A0AAV4N7X5_CAEEX|nr:hypothetical protein CEXT_808361 [Caerostris extrusa]